MKPFDHEDDALKQLFQSGGTEEPPIDFSQSVMDRIQAEAPAKSQPQSPALRPRRLLPMHWVAAACVAVLIFLAISVLANGNLAEGQVMGEWTTHFLQRLHLPPFSPYLVLGLGTVVGLLFIDRALRRIVRPQG